MELYLTVALCVLLLVVTYLFQWYYKAFNGAAHRHNALLKDFHRVVKAHDEVVVKYNEVATVHNALLEELRKAGALT